MSFFSLSRHKLLYQPQSGNQTFDFLLQPLISGHLNSKKHLHALNMTGWFSGFLMIL